MTFDVWNLMAGGAAVGVLASCWDNLKTALWKLVNLFIQQVEMPSEEAHDALVAYLVTHYKRLGVYDHMYGANYEQHRNGRYGLVPYEFFGSRSVIFWNGWWPFLFSNEVENRAKGGKQNQDPIDTGAAQVYSTLTFLRGTLHVEALLRRACDNSNKLSWSVATTEEMARNRFVIHRVSGRTRPDQEGTSAAQGLAWYQQRQYRLLAHKPDELGKAAGRQGKALANLIFPQRTKDLFREIELWASSRSWYVDRGIAWKRGWLLYGPPGTGKTALARAFAEDLNVPLYVFNLAEMTNRELTRAWTALQVNVPCIALIEDIDNVFHGRKNVAREPGMSPIMIMTKKKEPKDERDRPPRAPLTFDCLLNCLDGVERSDGIFTIITTNDPGKVDPALGRPRKLPDGTVEFISTRPGRIDKAVELTYMEPDDKRLMARRILGDYPKEFRAMLEFIDAFPDLQESPAQFQERCGQAALACFWKEQEHGVPGVPASAAQPERLPARRDKDAARAGVC